MARAQASTEMIVIMGIFFIVLLVFVTYLLDYAFSIRSQRDFGDAQSAVDTLAAEADATCAQGTGAEKIVRVTLPSTALLSPNESFIGRPLNSLAGKSNTITLSLGGAAVSAQTVCTVVGSFPNQTGVQYMKVTSYGNFVGIGSHLASTDPNEVFLSMGRSETKSATLTFSTQLTESTDESVRITLSSPWNYTNAALSIAPSSFSSYGLADVPVSLSFTANASAVGIYTSLLNVTAERQSSGNATVARETFTVPLTLEVT